MIKSNGMSLLFIPIIRDQVQLNNILARSAWHFSYSRINKIVLLVLDETLRTHKASVPDTFDPTIEERMKILKEKLVIETVDSKKDLVAIINRSDIILQWENDLPFNLSDYEFINLKKGKKFWHVDSNNTRLEGSYYIEAAFFSFRDKKELIEESKAKFKTFSEKIKGKIQANILATGPSVGDFKKLNYDNSINIICNTLILDEELMKTVNPNILVFADPIFHFGVSRYAYEFRSALRKALSIYDFYVIVPLKYYPLAVSFLPDFCDRVIGVPYEKDYKINLDLSADFFLKSTPNILTFLMIPLATTFAPKIGFLGCDGRLLCNDQYFWSHNPATQLNKELKNIQEVHPGFFKTDYNEYYVKHCATLEEYIRTGEKSGYKFYSLAPSYIPALKMRQISRTAVPDNEKLPKEQAGRVLIIDPDGESIIGHYYPYNDKMQKSLEELGAKVDILCNKNIDPEILVKRNNYYPELSVKTYYVGVAEKNQVYISKAYDEFKNFLDKYLQKYSDDVITIYMYVGSLQHLDIIYRIVKSKNNVRIVMNLFRLSYVELNKKYISSWIGLLKACFESNGRFVVTVPTKELQDKIYNLTNYLIPVAAHPSTTFSDDEFPSLFIESDLSNTKKNILKVLFPGLPRHEKGYHTTLDAIRYLIQFPNKFLCSIRHVDWQGTPKDLKILSADIKRKCNVISGNLDEDSFKKMFSEHDVVVLPYDPFSFKNRTSGLLIDSLYAGLPVITVNNTWLGRVVHEYECGVVVNEMNPESIYLALKEVLNNYKTFVRKAKQASMSYFCRNNWSVLALSLLIVEQRDIRPSLVDTDVEQPAPINIRPKTNNSILIIGNGLSTRYLAHLGFDKIPSNVDTFGMGAAYRYFGDIGWWPTYYALCDSKVVFSHKKELKTIIEDPDIPIRKYFFSLRISDSEKLEVVEHGSTGDFCLKKAVDLGYKKIFLIGIDNNYIETIKESRQLTMEEIEELGLNQFEVVKRFPKLLQIITKTPLINTNYFFDEYQKKGDIYSLPRGKETHYPKWQTLSKIIRKSGVEVINLSDISKLDMFPKADLEDFLNGRVCYTIKKVDEGDSDISKSLDKRLEKSHFMGESEVTGVKEAAIASAELKEKVLHKLRNILSSLQTLYDRLAKYLILNHPIIARLGRFGVYCLRTLKRRFFGIGGLSVLAIIALYVGSYASGQHRWLLAGSGTGLLLLLTFGLAISYSQFLFLRYANNQHREMHVTFNRISNIDKKILNLNYKLEKMINMQSSIDSLSERTNQAEQKAQSLVEEALNRVIEQIQDIEYKIGGLSERTNQAEQKAQSLVEEALNRTGRQILNIQSSIDDEHLKINQLENKIEHILETQQLALSGIQNFLNVPENMKNNIAQCDSFIRKINSGNTVLFQRFNRQLRWEDINRILKNWLPKLGLTLDANALGYFAHRICLTEDTCIGRLATGIEDELLRVLVARSVKDQNLEVLEIGTLFGVGIAGIYEICRGTFDGMHITVIDPFDGYYGKNELDVLTKMPVIQETFIYNMQRMNISKDQYTVINKFSTQDEAIMEAAKRQYNLLIIDGDHSFSGVKFDFYNYRGMVKLGGYIIFDDYNTSDWPDIKAFVDQEVIDLPELQFIGADWRTAVFRVITPFGLVK